jgi:hypothetical protein
VLDDVEKINLIVDASYVDQIMRWIEYIKNTFNYL